MLVPPSRGPGQNADVAMNNILAEKSHAVDRRHWLNDNICEARIDPFVSRLRTCSTLPYILESRSAIRLLRQLRITEGVLHWRLKETGNRKNAHFLLILIFIMVINLLFYNDIFLTL